MVRRTKPQGSERAHPFHEAGVEIPVDTIDAEWGQIRASGRYVPVGDQLVPESLELELHGDKGRPSTVARLEVRDGRPEVVEVRLVSRKDEPGIRQTDLRSIEVSALVELLAGFALQVDPDGVVRDGRDVDSHQYRDALDDLRTARGVRRVTHAFLEDVANVYRENLSDRPTLAVQNTFLVGSRMASEYVQRARIAGLLPKTTPGQKKG